MQRLEVSGAVRPLYGSLVVKGLKGRSYRDYDFSLQGTKGLTKAYVRRDRKDSNQMSILFSSFIVRIVKEAALKVQFGYGQYQNRVLGHPGVCPPRL
jgi:hypothetical protein